MGILPAFYPIVDTAACGRLGLEPLWATRRVVEAGADVLQLRHKGAVTRTVFELAEQIRTITRDADVTFVVNDRVDLALAVKADGVHLGQEDLPPDVARRISPAGFQIGYSTHTETQLIDAGAEPVDYLAIGPVFATGSKERADPVVGLAEVARLRALCDKPLVAIGGITYRNAGQVLAAGADSVAVISGWLEGSDAELRDWVELRN